MKRLLFVFCVSGVVSAFAVPSISVDKASPRNSGRAVQIVYSLANEPAVVTLGLYEKATGAYIGEAGYTNLVGDVNCLVQPGGRHAITWTKAAGWSRADADVDVRLRAWPTNCPPNYLVLDLSKDTVRYYVSTDAMPFRVTDYCAKTDYLIMRKIPAANVEWRMGSAEAEGGNGGKSSSNHRTEGHHYVRLTEDFYLGIYPVTHGQQKLAVWDGASYGAWGKDDYKDVCTEDMPMAPLQFVSLRAWMHDNSKGCMGDCGVHNHTWPEDGHEIDAAGASKCAKTGSGKDTYTPYLRKWRSAYRFEFDLPTEAQWEFACRAGTDFVHYGEPQRADYSTVPSNIDDYAWHVGNSTNEVIGMNFIHPVGLKEPNAFGLYDMLGNVWEWCLDNASNIAVSSTTVTDPIGPEAVNDRNRLKVLRGGSFCSLADACRSASRLVGATPNLENATGSAPAISSAETSKWQYGYRLCIPARIFR